MLSTVVSGLLCLRIDVVVFDFVCNCSASSVSCFVLAMDSRAVEGFMSGDSRLSVFCTMSTEVD